MSGLYDDKFYEEQRDGSARSAFLLFPFVIDLLRPNSVLDIGCGVGTWLKVLKQNYNISDVLGVDGDYVDKNMLQIDNKEFVSYNLENAFDPPKKYDLAMSLEVGEHLPDRCADNLVKSLTNASDIVLFSAALPGQTGTFHINEQWPEYWAEKFAKRGYVCVDCIRKKVWNIRDIKFWYRQNTLLYIKKEVYEHRFKGKLALADPEFLTRIHPELMHFFKDKFFQTKSFWGFVRYKLYPVKALFSKQKRS